MTPSDEYMALSMQTSGYFECQLPIISETEKAICFDTYSGYLNKEKRVWIPKSQIQIVSFSKDDCGKRYFIKKWLYRSLQ